MLISSAIQLYSLIQKTIYNSLLQQKLLTNRFKINHVADNLYFGPLPRTREDIKQLREHHIDIIISLNEPHEYIACDKKVQKQLNRQFVRHTFPTPDYNPISLPYLLKITDIFNQHRNKNIYIHCFKGVGRSATVTTILYMLMKNFTPTEAIVVMQDRFPQISMNSGQQTCVHNYYLDVI